MNRLRVSALAEIGHLERQVVFGPAQHISDGGESIPNRCRIPGVQMDFDAVRIRYDHHAVAQLCQFGNALRRGRVYPNDGIDAITGLALFLKSGLNLKGVI
jgi:hypothetical protein